MGIQTERSSSIYSQPMLEAPLLDKVQKYQQDSFDPKKQKIRYSVLLLVCYLKFVTYYTTESPGSIKQEVINDFNISNTQFGLLFSIYNLPNIVLALLTGIFIDKFGIRASTLLFTFLVLIGQALYTISCYGTTNYSLGLFGRFLLGAATESSGLAYIMIINHWFDQTEMGFACSILITIAKAGVSLTNFLTPFIYAQTGSLGHSFLAGVVLASMALILCFIFNLIDRHYEKLIQQHEGMQENMLVQINDQEGSSTQIDSKNVLNNSQRSQTSQNNSKMNHSFISVKKLKQLNSYFWVFIAANVLSYITLGPFQINFSQILRVRYGFDVMETGILLGYVAIVLTCLGLILGLVSDYCNKRMMALAYGNLLLFLVQMYFSMSSDCYKCYSVIIPMGLFELSLGIFLSNLQAAMNEIAPKELLGFCFGLLNSFQNLSMAIAPILIGKILDSYSPDNLSQGYVVVSSVMAVLNIICFVMLGYLGGVQRKGKQLNDINN
eukprot:403354445